VTSLISLKTINQEFKSLSEVAEYLQSEADSELELNLQKSIDELDKKSLKLKH
jgi:hypothetical protein